MFLPKQKIHNDDRYSVSKHGYNKGLNNIQETAQYYLEQIITDNKEPELVRLYKMLDDWIDENDYQYVLNPFNTKIAQYTRFRGKLRNFNIIAPVYEMLMSEFGRRKHYPRVLQAHPNDASEKEKAWDAILHGYKGQKAVNGLRSIGVDTKDPTRELPPVKQVKEEFERTYKAERVISGQDALDYIIKDKDLADKYIDLYGHYLVTGRAISYKGVNHNDIDFRVVHPTNYYFPHSENQERLEDRDWGVCRLPMTPSQLLDYHRGYLSNELVGALDEVNNDSNLNMQLTNYSGHMYMSDDTFNSQYRHFYKGEDNSVDHYHVVYKSFKRIAILKYYNTIGEVEEMEVEDNYSLDKANGDISIEYDFKNALYEAYNINFNGIDEWIRDREIPYDRAELNNSSKVKLPYNGVALTTIDGEIKSLVKTGKNYQVLYNILKYSFEKLINKNKDKIAVIPLGLLNKGQQGWDEEKAMYYAEANSTLFIDETSPTAALALQGIKVLDLSLGKYVSEVITHAQSVKQEWWDAVGFNRQRYGETMASDGKAVTEQAVFRSSLITENLIRKFEKYQEKDYSGLLDISKVAWVDGVKGQYVTTDGQKKLFELNDDNYLYYLDSDMDVHVVFSGEEDEKIKDLKGYLFNATQNGMSIVPVLEAMDANSFVKMKEIIAKEEQARKELEQQRIDADQAHTEKIETTKLEAKKVDSEDKKYVADKQYEGTVESALIKANVQVDEADEFLTAITTKHKLELDEREQDRKEKETDSKVKKTSAEVSKLKKETSVITKEKNNNNKTNN